jgi:hypothetical protein
MPAGAHWFVDRNSEDNPPDFAERKPIAALSTGLWWLSDRHLRPEGLTVT